MKMSDKERLEMIKGIQKRIKEYQEKGQNVSNLHSDYVEWLIQQVERVEKLEKEKDEWKYTAQSYYMTNQELREQNKRYREALNSIITLWIASTDATDDTWLAHEMSETARKALEGKKMTDKERLEEIKNSYLEGQHIIFGTSWVSMPKESFDWLIKQVEKVEQENEKEQKRLQNQIYETVEEKFLLEKQLRQAQAKAERYKQALEFYANEETYETKFATDTDEICDPFTLIELDNGQKARQALGG